MNNFVYIFFLQIFVDCVMMFIRVGTLVVSVLYFPAYTIKTMACGQFVVSTVLVVLYWIYFHQEFQKKAKVVKNKDLHPDDPLLALPFDSLRDFLPRKIQDQVGIHILRH
jgi:hypothetical protein